MFWTDWGEVPKIECASMDGKYRTVIVSTDLGEPYGITIDYANQKIYWADNDEDRIEYSDYTGGGRTQLVGASDGVVDPFGLTIYGDLLYWTDWQANAVYGTHKIHGTNPLGGVTEVIQVYTGLLVNPNGIEAVSAARQPGLAPVVFPPSLLPPSLPHFHPLPPSLPLGHFHYTHVMTFLFFCFSRWYY